MHDGAMLAEPVDWARAHVAATGWLKACSVGHGSFEPELMALLARERPELVPRVLACDAELQRDVPPPAALPDRTVERWPDLFEELAASPLPLEPAELERLRTHAPRFAELCSELASFGLPAAIPHDDLHHKNVDGERSLVVTSRFLEEHTGLAPGDPWFARLRDAYLEPWGEGLERAFELCERVVRFAHAFGWLSLRPLLPARERPRYDVPLAVVLRRALAVA